jgi:hypothetical protein
MVGAAHSAVWRQFAEEIDAQYLGGDRQRPESITARVEPWNVILTIDTSGDIASSQLEAHYVSVDGFTFAIRRVNGIHVGMSLESFEQDFTAVGSQPTRVRQIVANDAIRLYLSAERDIGLRATRLTLPNRMTRLTCHVAGVIDSPERLLSLFELMAETLQHLREIGSASDKDPLHLIV